MLQNGSGQLFAHLDLSVAKLHKNFIISPFYTNKLKKSAKV